MTAEIALLNRRALAFAADSAVTITGGANDKIFNTAEKIFEISRAVPMGLMIYNSSSLVGVPLDVLARKFRAEHDRKFTSCKDACEAFLKFLCNFTRYKENNDEALEQVIVDELKEIARKYKSKHPEKIIAYLNASIGNAAALSKPDFDAIQDALYVEIFDAHRVIHEARKLPDFLLDVTPETFRTVYEDVLKKLASRHIDSKSPDVFSAYVNWALSALRSDVFSDSLTGLVFGGFGEGEIFPSLYSVEVDGIFFDQIKKKESHDVDIDRRKDKAKVVPFAQSEMAERFLFGIDADTQSAIISFIEKSLDKAFNQIKASKGIDIPAQGITGASYASDINKFLERIKRTSRDEVLDMMDFMPKQELSYAAEAFVNLTSVKRKVSSQQETVGGPVDVAVITKNEGFIWIKRKHYFSRELNPGYNVKGFVDGKASTT